MKRVVKRTLRIERVLLVMISLLVIIGGAVYALKSFRYPEELINVATSTKQVGTHEISKSRKNGSIWVFHYPKTEFETVNAWVETLLDDLRSASESMVAHQVLVDYEAQLLFDHYISIQMHVYDDGILTHSYRRTYDTQQDRFMTLADIVNQRGIYDLKYDQPDLCETCADFLLTDHDLRIASSDAPIPFERVKAHLRCDLGSYKKYSSDPSGKYVALTFDDGPHPDVTPQILDLLDQYNAKATFFMLGLMAERYPDSVHQVYKASHQIATHTYTHRNLSKLSSEHSTQEIQAAMNIIHTTVPEIRNIMFRPPYGIATDAIKQDNDVIFINWSVDSEDWKYKDPQKACQTIVDSTRDGSVILMHDIYPSSVAALECALTSLSANGYQFVTIETLMEIRDYDFSPHHLHYMFPPRR